MVKQARAKARRAACPKSAHPITCAVFEQMLDTCHGSLRDCRDRALLMLGWASGGRRRSEIMAILRKEVSLEEFSKNGLVWISLLETKTTTQGETPGLVMKGRAAQALVQWIEAGEITGGFLFRPVSKADRVLKRRL